MPSRIRRKVFARAVWAIFAALPIAAISVCSLICLMDSTSLPTGFSGWLSFFLRLLKNRTSILSSTHIVLIFGSLFRTEAVA
jgi:hypothetical protein